MFSLASAQYAVVIVLGIVALAVEVYALVDAARRPEAAYASAGKLTRTKWLVILAVGTAIGFVSLGGGALGLLSLLAIVAAIVYLVDVRPALRRVQGGRGGGSGPYGPW